MPFLRFVKASPSGNTTVYILDPVPVGARAQVAAKIMREPSVCAEQVGFVEPASSTLARGRLYMMGGEFCANASRGFAAWLFMGHTENGMPALRQPATKKTEIILEASGCAEPLTVLAEDVGCENGCRVTLGLPAPRFMRDCMADGLGACTLVGFQGITHAVLWERAPHEAHMKAVLSLARENGLYDGCVGALFMNAAATSMTPLVYVAQTDTLVWESSCGSGTAAVACALAARAGGGAADITLAQPGGSLSAAAEYLKGRVSDVRLWGDVCFTALGALHAAF